MKNPTLKESLTDDVMYRVLSDTKCKTLQRGDLIRRSNDRIDCLQAGGWLDPGQWERFRCRVEIATDYYNTRITKAREDIAKFEAIIARAGKLQP